MYTKQKLFWQRKAGGLPPAFAYVTERLPFKAALSYIPVVLISSKSLTLHCP